MFNSGLILGLAAIAALLGSCAAPQAQQQQPQGWFDQYGTFVFLAAIFAVFYFLMVRPQRKRQKEHQKLMQDLKRGDRVVTAGGIYGEIESLSEDSVVLKVESGATIRVARGSILGVRQR